MIEPINLYIKDNTGATRIWTIGTIGNTIVIEHGQLGGKLQTVTETIEKGLAGRTLDEQIRLRVSSRISKQLDKGYTYEIPTEAPKNRLNLPKPMLAQSYKKVKGIDYSNMIVQPKFDGNRCMIAKINGEYLAYSRNGKVIPANLDHIFNDLNLNDGEIVDGELYAHGYSLQTIVSWVKKDQPNTKKLKYHLYDIVESYPYAERAGALPAKINGDNIVLTPSERISSASAAMEFHSYITSEGYEGAILRWGDWGYEAGKRSKSLVKVKAFLDDIFKVIDILPSKDGWARLTCITQRGKIFNVSAPGTIEEKFEVYYNAELYIGRMVRVEFMNYTKDNIPFHPVATNWE